MKTLIAFCCCTLLACGGDLAVVTLEEEAEAGPDKGTVEAELTNTKVNQAITYGLSLVGHTPYGWWMRGPLPLGAPMWTATGPAPAASAVTSTNCSGLTNLILRSVGRQPPTDPNGFWARGGTAAYWRRFVGVSEPFNVNKSYPAGTLLMRNYRNVSDQGHVAVVLGNGRVLQSFANCFGCTAPGVNATFTVAQSHDGGFYERAVLPQHWLGSGTVECAFGDGFYCGGNGVSGNAGTLYRCTGSNVQVVRSCANGCVRRPPGVDDFCRAN